MILRLWLTLALLVVSGPLHAERAVNVFFFGNDLVRLERGGDENAVPYWLAQMAAARGVGFAADGVHGTPEDFARNLPPHSQWRIDGVERLMSDNPRSFRMAGFDTLVLALPDAAVEDEAELIRRTFDWAGRQGLQRFLVYEGWPSTAPESRADDVVAHMQSDLPEAQIGTIPVARITALLLADGPLTADPLPEGTPSAYLLAAMITWSALQDGPAPLIDLPANIIPELRDNYAAVADAIWLHLAGAVAPEGTTLQPPEMGFAQPSLAFGLNGISDWSSEMPFLDIMKTARPWFGHLPGQWGGVDPEDLVAGGFLSAEGWPLAIPDGVEALETLILTDLSPAATDAVGQYVVTWEGEGSLELTGRATDVEHGDHEARFSFTPGPGLVGLRVTAINPDDPIRNIRVIREDRLALARAGVIFNPDFIAVIQDARMLRFMDWMYTNNSTQANWSDRPRPEDATWAAKGVPVEVMVELANRTGTDPWFTLPHMADDDYIRHFAQYVHDHLDPRLRAHAEWSNEVWNFMFGQAHWAMEQARARWGEGADGDAWVQFAGTRAAEVADIWAEVFADDPERLVRVVATHTAWLGLEEPLLEAPRRQREGLPPPADSFDAYAVTGYFGLELSEDGLAPDLREWISASTATERLTEAVRAQGMNDVINSYWPHHVRVAADRGFQLHMYEGGTHLVGSGSVVEDEAITAFLTRYNYGPEVAEIYADLLAAWHDLGTEVPIGPFNAFVDIAQPSRWGSWGARRHTGDVNPRWATLAAWNSLPFVEDRDPSAFLHGVLRVGDDADGVIEGTAEADILIGGAGDDTIVTGGGNDLIAGGNGHTRVILPGSAADWTPAHEGEALWMIGAEGEVRLIDVDEITFADEPDAVLTLGAP